jgi:hypothetical protein
MRTVVDAVFFAFSLRSACDRFIDQPVDGGRIAEQQPAVSNWLRRLASRVSIF